MLHWSTKGRFAAPVFMLIAALHVSKAWAECAARVDFDHVVAPITERFFDRTFRGLSWTARVAHYRQRVRCGSSEQAIAALANELAAELHASHTGVFTRTDLDYWGFNSVYSAHETDYPLWFSGIWARQDGSRWYARYVLEGSPAARAGVLAGDELVSLNGVPFSPVGFTSGPDRLLISSDGKSRRELALTARHESVMQAFMAAAEASARIDRFGERRIGYFHLWGARAQMLELLRAAMRRFETERVNAVVIDLRGGYGGTSPEYLDPLRQSTYLMGIPRYFLIDDSVRSGKELIAATASRDHVAELVGSRTAGAFLGGVPARIDGDRYFVLIAAFGGTLPDLPPIEGVGVAPAIAVDSCRTYCRGRDPLWDKVVQLATGNL